MEAMIKEKPILFSGPMVRAILEGRKTQTRRVVKLQDCAHIEEHDLKREGMYYAACGWCPYGKLGDRLWVKETHGISGNRIFYAADVDSFEWAGLKGMYAFKTRPSIFMSRRASRITLQIESIRVERLQDISEEDAKAEGVTGTTCHEYVEVVLEGGGSYSFGTGGNFEMPKAGDIDHAGHKIAFVQVVPGREISTAKYAFVGLWDSINAKTHPWKSNPWVWVIGFKRA